MKSIVESFSRMSDNYRATIWDRVVLVKITLEVQIIVLLCCNPSEIFGVKVQQQNKFFMQYYFTGCSYLNEILVTYKVDQWTLSEGFNTL